jgi:hypothetical protein
MPFGWGKRSEDVSEIKEAVTGPQLQPYPLPPKLPDTSLSYPRAQPSQTAPLFVKVERYKEILETVAKLKGTVANIESVFKAREAIDGLKQDADALMQRQVQVCNDCITALDSAFVRPPALEQMVVAQPEVIEGDLQMLSSKLSQLSNQLRQLG